MEWFPTCHGTCYNGFMIRPEKIRWPFFIPLVMGFWICHSWASAQAGVLARVSDPSTDFFPSISLSLSIIDNRGEHIPNLSPQNFTVIEDGEAIPVHAAQETTVGTQQIFILNATRGLRGRDALGLTRYDYVRSALLEWWAKEEAAIIGMDDLSLMSLDGNLVMHSSSTAQLATTLHSYEPALEDETASYDLLLQALDVSAEAAARQKKPSFIFFITPLITEPEDFPLANTIAWAKENLITIYPILVGPEELMEYPQVDDLELLAETTGGELVFFDDRVGLDFLAERILTRRKLYSLSYTSKANTSGPHNLQIRITSDSIDVLSDPIAFRLNISAPELIFIQPPEKITRATQDPTQGIETVPPTSTTLRILAMFPDGYPRDIVYSQFAVDGQLISAHSEPPFDIFEWDLSGYSQTGTHEVVASVEDVLGLQASTDALPILVEVILPPRGIASLDPGLVTALVITVVATLATIAGVSTVIRRRRLKTASALPTSQAKSDQRQSTRLFARADRIPVEATLLPIASMTFPITLIGTDLILGRDASISAVRIDDPSVSALHARIIRLASGDYLIRDQGSVAGTWVNYQAIPERGKILAHGDLIHLGRVILRFQVADPPTEARFRVKSVDSFYRFYAPQEKKRRGPLDEE